MLGGHLSLYEKLQFMKRFIVCSVVAKHSKKYPFRRRVGRPFSCVSDSFEEPKFAGSAKMAG